MSASEQIDLREAVNAISDVIANRPRPIRQLDQIYMKAGDMVLQSEFVARWAQGKRLAFIGDGDAISVCVAYLYRRDIISYAGPRAGRMAETKGDNTWFNFKFFGTFQRNLCQRGCVKARTCGHKLRLRHPG